MKISEILSEEIREHAVITQDHKFQNHVLSFREVDTIICLEIQRANIPSTLGLMLPHVY